MALNRELTRLNLDWIVLNGMVRIHLGKNRIHHTNFRFHKESMHTGIIRLYYL